jgi:SAM domain (Sterile alpha motif)
MDVADWLRELGPERYEAAFRENDVDAELLLGLTDTMDRGRLARKGRALLEGRRENRTCNRWHGFAESTLIIMLPGRWPE